MKRIHDNVVGTVPRLGARTVCALLVSQRRHARFKGCPQSAELRLKVRWNKPTAAQQVLARDGYGPLRTSLYAVASEFDGLAVTLGTRILRLDIVEAAESTWPSTVRYWSARVGAELRPIGTFDHAATVVCADDLRAYLGFEEDLHCLGSFPSGLLASLTGRARLVDVPRLIGKSLADFVREDDP